MTNEQLTQALASDNLRLAAGDEAGWYYIYIDASGERVAVWVTDLS